MPVNPNPASGLRTLLEECARLRVLYTQNNFVFKGVEVVCRQIRVMAKEGYHLHMYLIYDGSDDVDNETGYHKFSPQWPGVGKNTNGMVVVVGVEIFDT